MDNDIPGPTCSPLTDAGTGDPTPCPVVAEPFILFVTIDSSLLLLLLLLGSLLRVVRDKSPESNAGRIDQL